MSSFISETVLASLKHFTRKEKGRGQNLLGILIIPSFPWNVSSCGVGVFFNNLPNTCKVWKWWNSLWGYRNPFQSHLWKWKVSAKTLTFHAWHNRDFYLVVTVSCFWTRTSTYISQISRVAEDSCFKVKSNPRCLCDQASHIRVRDWCFQRCLQLWAPERGAGIHSSFRLYNAVYVEFPAEAKGRGEFIFIED